MHINIGRIDVYTEDPIWYTIYSTRIYEQTREIVESYYCDNAVLHNDALNSCFLLR